MALAALAPGHEAGADAPAKLVMELVLGQRAPSVQRSLRRLGDLVERVGRLESPLGGQPPHLLAELHRQLVVAARDQRPAEEREVVGGERVKGSSHDVGHHQVTAIDRFPVALPGDAPMARREREQRSVLREVGRGAGRRLGEGSRSATRQPGAGEPEAEDSLGIHVS
jgi:hypothetical protein